MKSRGSVVLKSGAKECFGVLLAHQVFRPALGSSSLEACFWLIKSRGMLWLGGERGRHRS
jgi:hypothetical protein